MAELRIDTPCHEEWERMTPTERGRHCASCDREVFDLTGESAEVGRRMMREVRQRIDRDPAAHVCVHGEDDGRGRLLTPSRRRLLTNALTGMLAMAVAGCAGIGPELKPARDAARTEEPRPTVTVSAQQPRAPEPLAQTAAEPAAQPAVEAPVREPEPKPQVPRVIRGYAGRAISVPRRPTIERQAEDLVEPRGNG